MTARPILIDTTRLLTRLRHPAPTGIDRVDLAYARQYLGRQAAKEGPEGRAVALTSFGARLMPPRQVERLFAAIETRWSDGAAGSDPVLRRLAPRLGLSIDGGATQERRRARPNLPLADLVRHARGAHWPGAVSAPRDAIYLHTSHIRLDRPQMFEWLSQRPDIRPVFFVHDIIPIEYPEYGVPGEDARHRTRMDTVARHAAAIVVSCNDVARRVSRYLERAGLRVPPVAVAPIGVEPIFAPAMRGPAAGPPFFVVCSTIEARKNHLVLLLAWREIAERLGPATPTLVLVGRRGWESENVVDLLERSPAIREHVVEAPGLSNAGLVQLMASARAVLMPSFAEGYGIPVVEALAVGARVIASDLPAHREIAGPHATFVHPLDGLGWRDAILAAGEDAVPAPQAAPFQPPRWNAHFAIVDDLLRAL